MPPRSVHCPGIGCRSRHVMLHPKTSAISAMLARMWGGVEPTDHYRCQSCNALWEALPAGWNNDAVDRAVSMGPCDNCAYRASSPETRDPEKRAWLHDLAAADDPYSAIMSPFCCHKGVPLKLTVDPPSMESWSVIPFVNTKVSPFALSRAAAVALNVAVAVPSPSRSTMTVCPGSRLYVPTLAVE